MTTSLNPAIARIRTADDRVVGAGFLVGQRQVLTCAHVIDTALGRPRNSPEMPQAEVRLDFPLVAPNQRLTARVTSWQPGDSGDIAGLELTDDPPAGASPVRLVRADDPWGHNFRAFGFPSVHDNGVWASGRMLGREATGWLQIEDVKQTGYFIAPGFSGGPVWDETLDGVVGMTVAADTTQGVRTAFIIPTDRLVMAWPALEHSLHPSVALLGKLNNVPELPPHFLPRPEYLEPLKAALLGGADKPVVLTGTTRRVGLQGMGGIGKSVLAAALARDDDVRRAFPDGVLWVTLGQTPALTARQTQIADALEDKPHAFTDVQQGRACLSELLADKDCLLILDDVWYARHARPFDALGPRCRMLLTTRDAGLIAALGATECRLDVLDVEQALRLLARWARLDVETLPLEANEVAQECGNLPLALAMVGAMVRGQPERWANALHRLRGADLGKIRQGFPDYPYPDLLRAIQVSVQALEPEVQARYLDLAVFPEDTPIPAAVLQTFWAPEGLDEYDVQDVLNQFVDRSLARRDEAGRLTLHDLQYDYVRKRVGESDDQVEVSGAVWREHLARLRQTLVTHFDEEELLTLCYDLGVDYNSLPAKGRAHKARELIKYLENRKRIPELLKTGARLRPDVAWELPKPSPSGLPALHQRLLDAYAARCPAGRPSGPDDGYYFQHLAEHLMQSGRTIELRELLLDFDWLQAKLKTTDAADLIADYELLSGDAELRLIQGAIRLSAHVLAQDKAQLWSQLYGRLMAHDAPAIQAMLALWPETPWLRPLVPSLTPSGSPLLRTLTGHTAGVTAVAVTPDGRWAVSASGDATLKVWDLERGEELRTLTGHTGPVTAVAVTPDGRRAVSGSYGGMLKVWDLERGEELRTLTDRTFWVRSVAVTPDGRWAVSASYDETLKVWDLERGEELRTLTGHTAEVTAVAVTPDGRRVVSASEDHTLKVWDLERGEELRTLTGHTAEVNAVAVTPDGRRAVSASSDQTLKVWDLERGEELRTLTGHTWNVRSVAVTPDGQRAVSASSDKTLKVWNLQEGGEELRTLTGHGKGVNAVAVTPDGQRAVSVSTDGTLKVWDIRERGEELHTLTGHTGAIWSVAVTPDGRWAVSASEDHMLKVWDLERGEELRTLTGHTANVMSVAVAPDGRRVVSASFDETLKVWDLERGEELCTLTGHADWVMSVAVTPDGQWAVSASGETLKVWDLERGEELRTLTGHTGDVMSVIVTPDGRQAVSASYDRTLKVWDLERGEELHTLTGHTHWVTAVAVTPDGQRAVSVSYDQTLKVWDLREWGEELYTLTGHTGAVWAVAVTPDGRRAVSASEDRSLKVWDLENGTLVATFSGEGALTACTVAPDGTIVAGEELGRMHFLCLEGA